MSKYKSVILGCGPRAWWHAQAYPLISRGEMTACCDLDQERLEKFSQDFSLRGYINAEEMIEKEQPDLIHLITGPRQRVELMTLVHAHRVPACIVEKPIAYEVADWKSLVALEAASQTRFAVNAQVRYHPNLIRCHQALKSGKMGEILFIESSAVGTIADQGVHVLDWAMFLNQDEPVVNVFGMASGADDLRHPLHPSPDTTIAKLVFANGVRGMWNLGNSAPRVLDDDAYYKHLLVAVYAARGRVLFEEFGRWEIVSADSTEGGRISDMDDWAEQNHIAQANFTNAMFDWLDDAQNPPGTHLKRTLEQWNVVLGLYASTVYNKPIDLPFDPPDDLWNMLEKELSRPRA